MDLSLLGIVIAFAAGVISFLSPCVLPLVPGYVSYIAGGSLEDLTEDATASRRMRAIYLALFFVLGFSLVFVALGASAGAIGEFLLINKMLFENIAGWTPCIGPVLGAILTMGANTDEIGAGMTLLAFYSLGLGLPFVLAAAFTGFFLRSMKSMRRVGKYFQIGAGVIMVAMGIALITGYLTTLAYWLLELVPGLATLDGVLM